MAKKIKIIIERGKDMFGAWSENVSGIYGSGETVAETKKSIQDSIDTILSFNKENIPAALRGEYELVYQFDIPSFFNYYKGVFTNSALERITGINQKQLQHYASGLKKPRPTQVKKIRTAMHKLGSELLSVEL